MDKPDTQTHDGQDKAPVAKPRNMEARTEAFKKFNELEGRVVTEEAPQDASKPTDGSQSKSDTEPKTETKGEEKADAHPPKAEEKREPSADDKPKLVPLEALHEAREKLKARTLEARQKDAAIEALKAEVAEIKATLNKPKVDQKPETDAEKLELRRQLQATQAELLKAKSADAQKAQEDQVKQFEQKVETTDKALDEAGFPGFALARAAVEAELVKMFQAGELTREDCADPTVWKDVYAEKVFPSLEGRMEERKRKLTTEKKLEAKKKANLTVTPGSKPESNEDEEPEFTPETYFKKRRTLS